MAAATAVAAVHIIVAATVMTVVVMVDRVEAPETVAVVQLTMAVVLGQGPR
jgi:hypothetical protein